MGAIDINSTECGMCLQSINSGQEISAGCLVRLTKKALEDYATMHPFHKNLKGIYMVGSINYMTEDPKVELCGIRGLKLNLSELEHI